jgi:hypothetical protein
VPFSRGGFPVREPVQLATIRQQESVALLNTRVRCSDPQLSLQSSDRLRSQAGVSVGRTITGVGERLSNRDSGPASLGQRLDLDAHPDALEAFLHVHYVLFDALLE